MKQYYKDQADAFTRYDKSLYGPVKAYAAESGVPIKAVVESALTEFLLNQNVEFTDEGVKFEQSEQ